MLHKHAIVLAGVGAVLLLVQPSIARPQAVGPDFTITLGHTGTVTVDQPAIYTIVVSNIGGTAGGGGGFHVVTDLAGGDATGTDWYCGHTFYGKIVCFSDLLVAPGGPRPRSRRRHGITSAGR